MAQPPGDLPPPPRAQVAELPIVPPNRRNLVIGLISGAVIALIVLGIVLFRGPLAPKKTYTASQGVAILNDAARVGLRDTSFTIEGKSAAGSNSILAGISIKFKGKGELITTPYVMHIKAALTVAGISLGEDSGIEEISNDQDLYLKLSAAGSGDQHWQKLSTAESGVSSFGLSTNFLDYQHFKDAQLIGEDDVNGKQAWHLKVTLDPLSSLVPATATAVATNLGGSSVVTTEDLWIFEDNHLPAKVTFHAQLNGDGGASAGGINLSGLAFDYTITFTAWNTGQTIELPPADQVQDTTIPTIPSTPTPAP